VNARRCGLPNATVAAALLLSMAAAACGGAADADNPFARYRKPASYTADSARAAALAIHALGDSLPMRVDRMTKGEHGWQVRLLPTRGGTVGGGMVWIDESDSSATVVKRY
jgi:hypothetical protein